MPRTSHLISSQSWLSMLPEEDFILQGAFSIGLDQVTTLIDNNNEDAVRHLIKDRA